MQQSHSRLDIVIGPMFSGKTTFLLQRLVQLSGLGLKTLYINHSSDTRSLKTYSTHYPLLQERDLDIDNLQCNLLTDIDRETLHKYDVIGIDESQFFGEELLTTTLDLVDNQKKYVIVSGLNGDHERKKIGYILDLIPDTNNIKELHAYCKDCADKGQLKPGVFTFYNGQGGFIGGADKYKPVCRECYKRNKERKDYPNKK